MTGTKKRIYPQLFALLTCLGAAWGFEPVDSMPISDFVAALKNAGHERIAQGYQSVPLPGRQIGTWSSTNAPFMLTTNKQNGDWTISIFHDQDKGGTLLTGRNLQRLPSGQTEGGYTKLFRGEVTSATTLALFIADYNQQRDIDRNIVEFEFEGKTIRMAQGDLRRSMINRVEALKETRAKLIQAGGSTSEISKIDALVKEYSNVSGRFDPAGETSVRNMRPTVFELRVAPNGAFKVVIFDRSGKTADVAVGETFSEKP